MQCMMRGCRSWLIARRLRPGRPMPYGGERCSPSLKTLRMRNPVCVRPRTPLTMTLTEVLIERLQNYLRQLTQQTRSRLLVEVERLKLCGEELPGSEVILANL